ncbi:flagellin [Anaerovibrio lipolyticus]|uniref:flagellin n=1 Tax=Anaerovibrio lipolyticus TaxID=82374 RepID=UPI0004881CA0|nr:flagellin [Anaerovibrio lipolyticus]
MSIVNNISSNMILGELHKNTKKKDKASAQLALGEKIRNAGDDASGLAISEKMRVRIRALGQDEANVKNGASMLRTAEGAIQSQINLLRTIKEKVIDAHNDTNTDTDRMIIQKEISQYYDEINDIAAETTFNKKLLLLGNTVQEVVKSWEVLDYAVLVEDSDSLDLIPNVLGDLDEEPGPFDTFGTAASTTEKYAYDGYNVNRISATTIPGHDTAATTTTSQSTFHGGTANTANVKELDLSSYNVSALDNTAFRVRYKYSSSSSTYADYVLTTDSSKKFSSAATINISGMDKSQIASAIASRVNSNLSGYYTASASGEKVTFTTKDTGTATNNTNYYNVTGITKTGGTSTTGYDRDAAPATGLGNFKLGDGTQGKNAVYDTIDVYDPTTDMTTPTSVLVTPATYATITKDISSVPAGSGITLTAGSYTAYLVFVDGTSAPQRDSTKGQYYYTVGKNCPAGSFSFGNSSYGGMKVEFSNGSMKLTSLVAGTSGDNYGATETVSASSKSSTTYSSATALADATLVTEATNGETAHWDWDLADYKVSDVSKANELIEKLVGKAFLHSAYNYGDEYYNYDYPASYGSYNYEFIDTGKAPSVDSIAKLRNSTKVDLNTVRESVASGQTVAEAFANLITSKVGSVLSEVIKNGSDEITGVKIKATTPGTAGNSQAIIFKEPSLRDYTIDFATALAGKDIPTTLDGKGIRFYCATDKSQWVNVQFVNGISPDDDDRPASGTETLDIKTFVVDVADVTDVESLLKTIYEGDGNRNPQGLENWLTSTYKHFFHVAADYDEGTLTIYDNRLFNVKGGNYASRYTANSFGAKIADGVMDNVIQSKRNVYVNDLVIHHTDRSSANIHVRIPQTTMDHIFGYKVGTYSLEDYSVLTSEKREKLLGTDGPPKVEGTLDKGLQYLIDANTLIGAQIVHMEFAEANIITDQESTMSAESVIRDADMAKSSLELATAQILSQAGQTMLSQSNQNSSNVLSLLQ